MIAITILLASLIAGTVVACALFAIGMAACFAASAADQICGRDDVEVGERR